MSRVPSQGAEPSRLKASAGGLTPQNPRTLRHTEASSLDSGGVLTRSPTLMTSSPLPIAAGFIGPFGICVTAT